MKVKDQTSGGIMLRNVMGLVTTITIGLGVLIVIAVSNQLLTQVRVNTTHIVQSLKKTVIDGDDDWENWRRNSTLDTSSSRVLVHNMRKDARRRNYYSPYTRTLLRKKPVRVPFIKDLYYRDGKGLFYHQTGHAAGIRYDVWQRMDSEVEVLERVVEVTVVLLMLTMLLSPFFIRRLTHRLTDPLTQLSEASRATSKTTNDDTVAQLPVPSQPTEVTNLAQDFNGLLTQLHERQEQQKLFIMNAAHELRTPIATIRSHAQLIERHGEAHPEIVAKSVDYITAESRQMQQLIDELLTLSRADQVTLALTKIDLSAAVEQAVNKLTPEVLASVHTDIQPHLSIDGNLVAIEHVVHNLVGNAAKYGPAKGPITVTLIQRDALAELSVTDVGPGIADDDKAHVFERFYRADDVRGTVAGTGLGLPIVQQLVQKMGGQVRVLDHEPYGAKILVTLPLLSATAVNES
ncbi:sensor histidine kinase [Lacticaseibacillus pantheris]